jgi:methyl-accepting chemotaxis protein
MIAAHGMWKYRLHEAIRTGSSAVSVESIEPDNKCLLGQWLYGEVGRTQSGDEYYERIRTLHTAFHKLAAEILRFALRGRREEASRALESGSEFLTTSARLVRLLDAWSHDTPAVDLDDESGTTSNNTEGVPANTVAVVSELMGTSLETAAQANVAAGAAELIGSNIEYLSKTTGELAATIRQIAESSAATVNATTAAVHDAEVFTERVLKLTAAIGRIEQVLSFIGAIARQTNMLALNATIEAARAGEAGRGFTVVAAEVKELANQAASATADVTSQIAEIQGYAAEAIERMSGFNETIQSAMEAQVSIAAAVEQQEPATAEISRRVLETAGAGREIAENVAAVALAARNGCASAHRLLR